MSHHIARWSWIPELSYEVNFERWRTCFSRPTPYNDWSGTQDPGSTYHKECREALNEAVLSMIGRGSMGALAGLGIGSRTDTKELDEIIELRFVRCTEAAVDDCIANLGCLRRVDWGTELEYRQYAEKLWRLVRARYPETPQVFFNYALRQGLRMS